MDKYRTRYVDAQRGRGEALTEAINSCEPNERLHSVVSLDEGGGYTGNWVVIFEREAA